MEELATSQWSLQTNRGQNFTRVTHPIPELRAPNTGVYTVANRTGISSLPLNPVMWGLNTVSQTSEEEANKENSAEVIRGYDPDSESGTIRTWQVGTGGAGEEREEGQSSSVWKSNVYSLNIFTAYTDEPNQGW